jgi:hypothetical protein
MGGRRLGIYVAQFVAILVFSGCGPGNKLITVVNESSGIQLTTRYVTSTKSVIVKSKEDKIKFIVKLPDSVPRVNRNILGIYAMKYDFNGLWANKYNTWIKLVANAKSDVASETCSGISTELRGNGPQDVKLVVKFDQNDKGDLSISVWDELRQKADGEEYLVYVRARSGGAGICISSWASNESLWEVVNSLLKMREGYIKLLTEKLEGEGYKMGNKLKRSTDPIKPEEPQEDDKKSTA